MVTKRGTETARRGVKQGVWWVARVTAALVLGVATTLGVAYGGAVFDSTLDFGGYGNGDLYMLRETNTWWDVVTVISDEESSLESVARVRAVKSWDEDSIAAVAHEGGASGLWPRDVVMIGWPARCLWGTKGGNEEAKIDSLVDAPEWVERVRFVYQPLPTGVWWPGMAKNAVLFGIGWMVVVSVPWMWRAARGRRRERKGWCVACGYDLKSAPGGVCPECGAGAKGRDA